MKRKAKSKAKAGPEKVKVVGENAQESSESRLQSAVLANAKNTLLRLPTEVTSHIFLLAQDLAIVERFFSVMRAKQKAMPRFGRDPHPSYCNVEVTLSHTCHHWRSLALDLPSLWTNFRYIARLEEDVPSERFDAYMERSCQRLMDLTIDVTESNASSYDDLLFVEKVVYKCRERIRRLTLASGDYDSHIFPFIVHDLPSMSLPKIEYISLRPGCYHEAEEGDDFSEPIQQLFVNSLQGGDNAPMLSHVFMDAIATYNSAPPLSNVTILQIEGICYARHTLTYDALASILSLPLLTGISFKFDNLLEDWPEETPTNFPVTMPKLKTLRLSTHLAFTQLLFFINAPVLEYLTLQDLVDPYAALPTEPVPLEYPFLKSLTLIRESSDVNNPYWTNASLFPAVSSLTLFDCNTNSDHFRLHLPEAVRSITLDVDITQLKSYVVEWADELRASCFKVRVSTNLYRQLREENPAIEKIQAIEELDPEDSELLPKMWPENGRPMFDVATEDYFYDQKRQ